MGTSRRPTLARLKRIMQRQANPTWDTSYTPAIFAVRGEAPSVSHALTVAPSKTGRKGSASSFVVRALCSITWLLPPGCGWSSGAAHALSRSATALHNFPNIVVARLQPLKGVIDAAERLGYLSMLPRVRVEDTEDDGRRRDIIFPYVGDLLWAVESADGGYYCVNWSVRDSESTFKRPLQHERFVTPQGQVLNGLLARHEIEQVYYADAGIRTVLVAANSINVHVCSNLRYLFLHHGRKVSLPEEEQAHLLARFQRCLETGTPPSELIVRLTGAGKYSIEDCKNVLYQGVWYRKLRVDLQRPILIDRPLQPEEQDILEIYSDLFADSPC